MAVAVFCGCSLAITITKPGGFMFFVGEVIFGPCIVKQYPVSFFIMRSFYNHGLVCVNVIFPGHTHFFFRTSSQQVFHSSGMQYLQ